MAEIWKDVLGYEELYQVSSLGRVKRLAGYRVPEERILQPWRNAAGYLAVGLWRDGRRKHMLVHRLVAIAFLGKAPPGCEVNHKNGIKDDNRVENLEWVTQSENGKHAYDILGRRAAPSKGEANGSAKLTRREVVEIRKLYATGRYTYAELGKMFGVDCTNIGLIVRRETWQHVP